MGKYILLKQSSQDIGQINKQTTTKTNPGTGMNQYPASLQIYKLKYSVLDNSNDYKKCKKPTHMKTTVRAQMLNLTDRDFKDLKQLQMC